MLVGRPVVSRTLSMICPLASSNTMRESGYAPINSVAPCATAGKSVSRVRTESNVFIFAPLRGSLWEDQIQITPVFCRCSALVRPIGRVVEVIGYLRGPETSDVAIVDVALHRLAEPGRAARRIHFPSRRKRKRAAHGDVRPRGLWRVLQCDYIFWFRRGELTRNAACFLVQGAQVLHDKAFLSANNLKNSGLWILIAP